MHLNKHAHFKLAAIGMGALLVVGRSSISAEEGRFVATLLPPYRRSWFWPIVAVPWLGLAVVVARPRARGTSERTHRRALREAAAQHRTAMKRAAAAGDAIRFHEAAGAALRERLGEMWKIAPDLADTLEESDNVLAMLRTLMDITEAETGVMKLDRTHVDLSELARDAIDVYQDVAEEKSIRLLTHLSSGVNVKADRIRLRQVIANLLDNAVKYTPAGGQVEVTTTHLEPWVSLEIKDTGVGIPFADLSRIWQRLYRADQPKRARIGPRAQPRQGHRRSSWWTG